MQSNNPTAIKPPIGMLTPSAVAEQLGLPVDTIRKWVRRGLVPSVRFGTGNRRIALEPGVISQLRQEV